MSYENGTYNGIEMNYDDLPPEPVSQYERDKIQRQIEEDEAAAVQR
jgi:hypothetical protein